MAHHMVDQTAPRNPTTPRDSYGELCRFVDEPRVVSGKDDGLGSDTGAKRAGGAITGLAGRGLADADDDAGRDGFEPLDIGHPLGGGADGVSEPEVLVGDHLWISVAAEGPVALTRIETQVR